MLRKIRVEKERGADLGERRTSMSFSGCEAREEKEKEAREIKAIYLQKS